MNSLLNIGFVLFLLIEVGFLLYFEKKIWKTFYTPLNFLMVPFAVVFLITLVTPSLLGYPEIYFPSLLVWQVGLFIFFIPSFCLGYLAHKRKKIVDQPLVFPKTESISNVLYVIVGVLLLFFVARLVWLSQASEFNVGSDEFGEQFSSSGLFGHILNLLLALEIYFLASYENFKKSWLSLLLCVFIVAFAVLNQVKSWVLIPIFAGMIALLVQQKMHLKLKWILIIPLIGTLFFFGSYFISGIARNNPIDSVFITSLVTHFAHYLTSGVHGLSVDMSLGGLEAANPEVIFSPFVNIVNLFSGEQLVSPINEHYLYQTNVRTFFGTLFVYSNWAFFVFYLLVVSSLLYLLRLLAMHKQSITLIAIDAWFCAMLAMGWFEFYFFHLLTIEMPMWLIVVAFANRLFQTSHKERTSSL